MKKVLRMWTYGFCLQSSIGIAGGLLPKGVGAYHLGTRSYTEQTKEFTSTGSVSSLGDRFNTRLNGQSLLAGKGGSDLQTLTQELAKLESDANGPDSIVNQLDLGTIHADVRGQVNAQFLGMGFGITDRWTVFAGVPYIRSEVHTQLRIDGNNNALAIRDQLGNFAYQEVRDGLTRASLVNADDVKRSISDLGYADIDHWTRQGIGDVNLGARTGWYGYGLNSIVKWDVEQTTTVTIPTGYTEDADILTDMSFGKGYYSFGPTVKPTLTFFQHYMVGGAATYTKNMNTTQTKRVPKNDEALVEADRKTSVSINPGDDTEAAFDIGAKSSLLNIGLRHGVKRHLLDEYSGTLEGNYDILAAGSEREQIYREISFGVDTTTAFRQKAFMLPMLMQFTAHIPITARNDSIEQYYEVSLTSFFDTK